MEYRLDPPNFSVIMLILLVVSWHIIADYYGFSFVRLLFYLLLAVILGSFRFHFKINDDYLTYKISFMKKRIWEKNINPNQIEQVKLIRIGWAKKAAIIKVSKGFNIRLAVPEPETAYDNLIAFARVKEIPLNKTKDYVILEK